MSVFNLMPIVPGPGCILGQFGGVLGRHEQRLGRSLGRSLTLGRRSASGPWHWDRHRPTGRGLQ